MDAISIQRAAGHHLDGIVGPKTVMALVATGNQYSSGVVAAAIALRMLVEIPLERMRLRQPQMA
ncbi:hypothetical protein [Bosea sp. ASV33]|uniref:hypothetical protein n=1 Tax=Bosea sp. ASV33 TaxID=2795106 RepID=UPI0018EB6744|nr:hypothetical protein [Bosea sp. ASV33]